MENLYYNLSEEEFSRSKKVLLWIFSCLFFVGGIYVLFISLILGHQSIKPALSIAPFGISLVVSLIAFFATIKRKDLFFLVDDEKIEFRYGIINAKKHSFKWTDVSELIIPKKQKKAKFLFKDGSSYVVDLTWIQKKKSSHIRKHIYQTASEKALKIVKVSMLKKD